MEPDRSVSSSYPSGVYRERERAPVLCVCVCWEPEGMRPRRCGVIRYYLENHVIPSRRAPTSFLSRFAAIVSRSTRLLPRVHMEWKANVTRNILSPSYIRVVAELEQWKYCVELWRVERLGGGGRDVQSERERMLPVCTLRDQSWSILQLHHDCLYCRLGLIRIGQESERGRRFQQVEGKPDRSFLIESGYESKDSQLNYQYITSPYSLWNLPAC
jgi:hypothetical protein